MDWMVEVPTVVRNKALAVGAADWLDELDETLTALAAKWAISVGRVYSDATEALVAEAALEDGTPAVLKVLVPRAGYDMTHEATVLRLCGGRGCVQLLPRGCGTKRAPPRATRSFSVPARPADHPAPPDPLFDRHGGVAACSKLRPAHRCREGEVAGFLHSDHLGGAGSPLQRDGGGVRPGLRRAPSPGS